MGRRKKDRKNEGQPPRNPNGTAKSQDGKVAPISRETGFQKLRTLKCFPEVHERICLGWPMSELAQWIQEQKAEYTDVQRVSLMTILQRYRESLPPGVLAQHKLPKAHREAIEEIERDIDEVKELTKLYRRQVERLDVDGNTEKKIGKLFQTMTQEIRVTADILKMIATLKMDLGLKERHLGTVDAEVHVLSAIDEKYEGTEIGKLLQNPKTRRRLQGIAEHALSLASRGITIQQDGEGEIVLVSEDESVEQSVE